MAIPIKKAGAEVEACCFCHQFTLNWTTLPDRTPGEQVACCKDCAAMFPADLVPTKAEWFEYHRSLRASRPEEG